MKSRLFVFENSETDKTIGVMIHDPKSSRTLLKVRPSDSSLMRMFQFWLAKPILAQVREEMKGIRLTRRFRVLPSDEDYGKFLVSKFVRYPYAIRFSTSMEIDFLDTALDRFYADFVDAGSAKVPFSTDSFAGVQW